MSVRTNQQWIDDLSAPGPERDLALGDLSALLTRGLGYALRSYAKVSQADIDDFVQEALLKVLAALHTFRGESRFMTWAQKIAVHLAISELRRKRWRDVPLMQSKPDGQELDMAALAGDENGYQPQPPPQPEAYTLQSAVLVKLRQAIAQDLTERQRQAMIAVGIQGMPLAEVAERMDTNPNALYKLLYDARQNLKKSLVAAGYDAHQVLQAFE